MTASRAAPNRTLAGGLQQSTGSRRHSFARRALVVAELAIALVFLTGAGLVAKTFWQVTRVDPGFRAEQVLLANFELGDRYTDAAAMAFYDALMARVRGQPGVGSAAWVQGAPMTQSGIPVGFEISVETGKPTRRGERWAFVEPDYFGTIGAELVAGRFLAAEDRKGAPRVAVVSEGYSARNLDGAPALGRTLRSEECNPRCRLYQLTIVGVVKEMVQEATDKDPYPIVFVPMAQKAGELKPAALLVRTSVEPAQFHARIRDEVRALDPQQAEPRFSSMEQALNERVAPRKFILVLLVAFAALAGGLAIIGLYSVLSYLVAERTREIGIRIAIGADSRRVTAMVLGQGLRLTIIGLVIGAAVSVAAVRVLRAWMYEMSVYDAPTFAAVAVLLCVVALVASWLPARRASRIDPAQALRAE